MREVIGRRVAGVVLVAAALLATSACGGQLPPGADGDLTNQWTAMAEPTSWRPDEAICADSFRDVSYRSSYKPVSCDQNHTYETVAVADFAGEAASRTTPPSEGSPDLRAAWADCDKKVTAHLGGDWRAGSVWFGVSLPSPAGWDGGARWYRCELTALDGQYGDPVSRTASLKGEFANAASPLKLGCYQYGSELVAIACNKSHNAEFVGVWNAGSTAFSSLKDMNTKIAKACRGVIAGFAKVPNDGNINYRTGVVWNWPSQADWEAGDHGVRCHLWLSKKKVTKSLRGAGTKGLPINYA
ncbi:septum formation family protein [Catellatospora paridis]|uniref:septum formation family protein n=1 Tax=Catellatospora paridis TaxID=1617086 RepID=UPI0018B008FC|nr:septum formation family protein [Catellatospora paridis]